MQLKIDSKERDKLKKEFEKLKTIEEKFNFWKDKLKIPYYWWPELPEDEYREFKINPKNQSDIELINTLTIERYRENQGFTSRNKLFDLEEFKCNFEKDLEKSVNKKNYIEYEIKKIQDFVNEKERTKNKLENFFIFGYKEYYINNISPDFKKTLFELNNLIELYNGYVIAQYHQFLNRRLNKPVEQEKLSHVVQMLILDYMGFGSNVKSNNKKAEIYSLLIRRDIETTRQYFSKLNGEKSLYNLNLIREYFDKAGCNDQIKLVEKDIDRINKRKK